MNQEDVDGCMNGIVILIIAIVVVAMAWSHFHPSPEEVIEKQRIEQRAADDRELAEWNRTQQLREMRADKAKAEEPK